MTKQNAKRDLSIEEAAELAKKEQEHLRMIQAVAERLYPRTGTPAKHLEKDLARTLLYGDPPFMDQRTFNNFFKAPPKGLKRTQFVAAIRHVAADKGYALSPECFNDEQTLRAEIDKGRAASPTRSVIKRLLDKPVDADAAPEPPAFVGYHRLFMRHPSSSAIQKCILRIEQAEPDGYRHTITTAEAQTYSGEVMVSDKNLYLFSLLPSQGGGGDFELIVLTKYIRNKLMVGLVANGGGVMPSAYRVITEKFATNESEGEDDPAIEESFGSITRDAPHPRDKNGEKSSDLTYDRLLHVLHPVHPTVGTRDTHVFANMQWVMEKLNENEEGLKKINDEVAEFEAGLRRGRVDRPPAKARNNGP